MTAVDDLSRQDAEELEQATPVCGVLRYRLAGLRLRLGRLWPQVRRLGSWLESEALPAVAAAGQSFARLQVREDGEIVVRGVGNLGPAGRLEGCGELCDFLRRLGIARLELDPRLEHNQVSDVLTLLSAHRRALSGRNSRGKPRGLAGRLLAAGGIQFACTQTRIQGDRLAIAYSYCMTRFSRMVRWFEQRYGHFSDHRALFHAAPRYALLPVAIGAGILLVYTFHDSWWLLLGATVAGAGVMFALVYLFFMVVGSIEYDNEEKAYRLQRAYGDLQRYARKIRDDLGRAQTVQQKLLPDLARMPLAGSVQWAGSFLPETAVGGDYFDVAALGPGRAAILFADVSGHGMAAALITAILKCVFQAWRDDGETLEQFALRANRDLRRLTPDGSFAVLFVGIYDDARGELTYCNCGHHPEPWYLPADGEAPVRSLSDARGMLLGVEEDVVVQTARRRLAPGDKVVLATDGLIEARNVEGELYGQDQLEALLQAHRARPVEALVRELVDDVTKFARGAEQTDDRTVLAFQIR